MPTPETSSDQINKIVISKPWSDDEGFKKIEDYEKYINWATDYLDQETSNITADPTNMKQFIDLKNFFEHLFKQMQTYNWKNDIQQTIIGIYADISRLHDYLRDSSGKDENLPGDFYITHLRLRLKITKLQGILHGIVEAKKIADLQRSKSPNNIK